MSSKRKSASLLSIVWAASLFAAYQLGGGNRDATAENDRKSSRDASLQNSAPGHSGGLSSNDDNTGAGGARPLSPSSSAANATGGSGGGADHLMRLLDGASGADLRRSEFRDIAKNLSLEEVVAVIGEIAALPPGPAQRDAYDEVISRWAQLDAGAALEHVATITAPEQRRSATMNVLRNWGKVDPAAAVAYAAANPNDDLSGGSLHSVFRGIGDSMDTSAALDFLSSVDDAEQQRFANQAVRELFERNDAEVVQWAEALPEGGMRDHAVQALAGQWARYDPTAAKAWIEQNTNSTNRPGAFAALAESWARVDPQAAAAWAQTLDGADLKQNGKVVDNVFRRWMEYDLADAAGYLVEQDPSPELDGAVEQYIRRIRGVDPTATMAWAESISDPKRRRNAVLTVAKTLRSQNPQAYADFIETSPALTQQDRDKLLGKPKEKDKPKKKDKDRRKK